MRIPYPTFTYEQALWDSGLVHVAGVDEVGRGAFAGPVVTAAVILKPNFPLTLGVHDSKLLKPQKRKELSEIIKKEAVAYSISEVCVPCINEKGIGKATQQSFLQAITTLTIPSQHILMDAFYIDEINKAIQTPIIKGDQKSLSIAAASIIAKVYRDELMEKLGLTYPEYLFAVNKGYGTKAHRDSLIKYGASEMHRKSFSIKCLF